MTKMKRNHWVPQAYLRPFSADADKREKIWRFGKTTGDPELKPIENVAVKFYLYTPRNDDGSRDVTLEQKLSKLESWLGHDLWHSVCTDMVSLDDEPLRKLISLIVAVMFLRNPTQFENSKSLHRQIVDMFEGMPEIPENFQYKDKTYTFDTSKWPEFRDTSEGAMKRRWIKEVSTSGWLAEFFMKMRWRVIVSEMPVFITTDNPVTPYHPSVEFPALKNPETSVLFPLSPTRLLIMDHFHDEPANQYYRIGASPGSYNILLFQNAIEYMFSHRHTDLVCAEMNEEADRHDFAR